MPRGLLRRCAALLALLVLLCPLTPAAAAGVVNINTAALHELLLLPGIGPARAQAILAHRRAQGLFLSVEELLRVPGIGPRSLERLRPLCVLSGPTTAARPRPRARVRRRAQAAAPTGSADTRPASTSSAH